VGALHEGIADVAALRVAFAVIALAAILLFYPALSFRFLNWDDPGYVLNNPWIRDWSAENLRFIFTQPYFANFLPLHLVSYSVDYSLWKLNPFGYHLQSVLLHAVNSGLALLVVRRMFGSMPVAFLAALFFAVHPSHVEAVAWISIRKDLLATAFMLLSVLFYLRVPSSGTFRWKPYLASLLFFVLALLSKVTVVVLPAFLLLLDRWKPEKGVSRPWLRNLASKIPYAAAGVWLVQLNSMAQTKAQASYAQEAWGYAVVKGHAAWSYLGLLAGVLRGSPNYDLPGVGRDPITGMVMVGGLLLLPIGAWLAYRARDRVLALGVAWIFIFLIPPLAFPLVTYMADRYLYAPSLGFCWIVAAGISALAGRLSAEPRRRTALTAGLALLLTLLFTWRTRQALPVYRDSESLWTYAMTRSTDFRVYTNLAEVRLEQGRLDEAERLLKIASSRVEDVTTYQNLGVLYFEQGKYPEAAAAIERAIAVLRRRGWDPVEGSVLYYSLGAVYLRLGDRERTEHALERAIQENPGNTAARTTWEKLRGSGSAP
jgi:protein O-mannosyl-transferase